MRYVAVSTLVLLLLVASLASAQPASEKPSLRVPTIIFAGAAAADWITTYKGWQRGAVEANPMYAWSQTRPVLLVTMGVTGDVAGAWAIHRVLGKRHPRIAKTLFFTWTATRVLIAVSNHRQCRADHPCR